MVDFYFPGKSRLVADLIFSGFVCSFDRLIRVYVFCEFHKLFMAERIMMVLGRVRGDFGLSWNV